MQPCYIYNISIFLDFGKLFYLLYYCPPRGAIKAPLDLTDRSLSQRLSPSQLAKPRSLRLLRNFKVTCTFDFVFNRSQDSELYRLFPILRITHVFLLFICVNAYV